MKQIILKQITMRNFRGAKEQVTRFNADITTISGRNGLGKSRHADAFIWCLTGKDTQDRTDFEIKTRGTDAEALKKADAEVELVLNVDGRDIKLRRVLVERWETPRGQIDEVFKGNKTVCYFDDVPVAVKEYSSRVSDIIDSETFKLLTNPNYFCEILDWKARRNLLSSLVGVSDEDAVTRKPELVAVLNEMSGKSEDDFAAWLRAQINPLKDKPKEIDIRIKQIQEDMPAEQDWTQIETSISTLESEIETKEIALNAASDESTAYVSRRYELQGEVDKLKREQRELVRVAEDKIQKEFDTANAEYVRKNGLKKTSEAAIAVCEDTIKSYTTAREKNAASKEVAVSTKMRLAQDYETVKSGNGVCPTCGGAMTDKLAGETLNKLIAQIDECNTMIQNCEEADTHFEDQIATQLAKIQEHKAEIRRLDGVSAPQKPALVVESIEGYNDLTERIKQAEKAFNEFTATHTNEEAEKLKAEVAELKKQATEQKVLLATRTRRKELQDRIAELEKQAEEIAVQRAALERLSYLFMQYRQTKAEILQERVNTLFTQVQFKMFTTTLDGNIVEACIPLINGAYYGSANSAAKLNAGLDIINTMCRHFDTTAPIWIDNAEGINHITPTLSQQIRLVVTEDAQLTIR